MSGDRCSTFSTLIIHDQKLHKLITCLHQIIDICRLSTAIVSENWLLVESRCQLSTVQNTVNHWLYIKVNNLCE